MSLSPRVLLAVVLCNSACAGQVRMSRLQSHALDEGREVRGVIVYQPTLAKLTHSFTLRVEEGKVIGSVAAGTCQQTTQKEEVSVVPDFSQPMLVRNASGWFSAAKFSVTLNNGMLASVNAEPTLTPSDVLSAVAGQVKAGGAPPVPTGTPAACNASPVLTAVARVSVP